MISKYDDLIPKVREAFVNGKEFRHYITPAEAKSDGNRIAAAIGARLRSTVDRTIRIKRYEHILVIRKVSA